MTLHKVDLAPIQTIEPSLASTAELVSCICHLSTAEAEAFLSQQLGPVISVAAGLRNLNRDEVASRLSPARAAVLLAAVELGRRAFGPVLLTDLIDGPESAAAQFTDIAYGDVEQFAVLLLTTTNRLLAKQTISTGTLDETLAVPRDVFRLAVKMNAHSIQPSLWRESTKPRRFDLNQQAHQGWKNPQHPRPRSPGRLSGEFHEPSTHYRPLGMLIP